MILFFLRQEYIDSCYRTGTVSLLTMYGERFDNILVNKSIFQDLEFPRTSQELGSRVLWVNIPKHEIPVIVCTFNKLNEFLNLEENEFSLKKEFNNQETGSNTIVEVSGNSRTGEVLINVDTGEDDQGALKININNNNNTGKLELTVDGEVNIDIVNKLTAMIGQELNLKIHDPLVEGEIPTEIKYMKGTGFSLVDEFGNQIKTEDGKIISKSDLHEIGKEDYKLKDLFYDIIDEVSNSTVATSIGTQPLLNKVQILQLKQKVDDILI